MIFYILPEISSSTLFDCKDTVGRCAISTEIKNHTTFHKVRIKWHRVSAFITAEDHTHSNKDTGGTAACSERRINRKKSTERVTTRIVLHFKGDNSKTSNWKKKTISFFFLVIIFYNDTPALIPRRGLIDVVVQWEWPKWKCSFFWKLFYVSKVEHFSNSPATADEMFVYVSDVTWEWLFLLLTLFSMPKFRAWHAYGTNAYSFCNVKY